MPIKLAREQLIACGTKQVGDNFSLVKTVFLAF